MRIGHEMAARTTAVAKMKSVRAYGGEEHPGKHAGNQERPAVVSEVSKVARRKFELTHMDQGATTSSEELGATDAQILGSEEATDDSAAQGTEVAQSESEAVESGAEVAELEARDREVREHERAHLAAAGGYTRGGASFQVERGPDGKSYAVGGEVSIDVSEVPGNPEATLQKAQVIQRAALAPAAPSAQDRRVASAAAKMANAARAEVRDQATTEPSTNVGGEDEGEGAVERATQPQSAHKPSMVDEGLTRLSNLATKAPASLESPEEDEVHRSLG